MKDILLHGSSVRLNEGDELKPSPSGAVGGDRVVFATPSRTYALLFISRKKWNNDDFVLGRQNGKLFFRELRPHAFQDFFRGVSGFIYEVSAKQFRTHPNIMKDDEVISRNPVTILHRHAIKDVWQTLRKRRDIQLLTFQPLRIHVAGVSGAGKSTLANKLKSRYGSQINVVDTDDIDDPIRVKFARATPRIREKRIDRKSTRLNSSHAT